MVECVLDAAQYTAANLNKATPFTGMSTNVALLIPTGDPIKKLSPGCYVVEGPEEDVLARYEIAYKHYFPDFLVRITGDCPLITPQIIKKHITSAVMHGLDYCSNSIDDFRTYVDGYDCEILSARAMKWLFENATSPYDREHVTTALKASPPAWAKFGVVISALDLSHLKFSVDTQAEFDVVKGNKATLEKKTRSARNKGYAVFRF